MRPTSPEASRVQAPALAWWLLIGGLPLAVWFGMQLAAPSQPGPVKDSITSKKTLTADTARSVTVSASADTWPTPAALPVASDQSETVFSVQASAPALQPASEARSFLRPLIPSSPLRRRAPARLPLVFREVDPAAIGLSEQDVADIAELQKSFESQIGQQNAHDPLYRQRWLQAQSAVDQELRSRLGWPLFNAYQIQASQAQ